jgi:hypothetical protein
MKRYHINLSNVDDVISEEGCNSHVYKVRSENGDVYCGKIPLLWEKYSNGIDRDLIEGLDISKLKNTYMQNPRANIIVKGLEHEAMIADKIHKINGNTPTPVGVVYAKVEGESDFYLPTFVNGYEEDMEMINDFSSDKESFRKFSKMRNKSLKECINEGLVFDSDAYPGIFNVLCSHEKGIKHIDFGSWGYGNNFSPERHEYGITLTKNSFNRIKKELESMEE